MDLAGVQGRLAALGVTLAFEDDPVANAAELTLQRQYRAALYIRRLEDVHRFLTDPLAPGGPAGPVAPGQNGLGPDYPFAQAAFVNGQLLNGLAESLDTWTATAVDLAINAAPLVNNPTPYEGWFTSQIYDPVIGNFDARVAAFFVTYPLTDDALTRIVASFQNNVATAARRIVTDRAAIAALFADLHHPGLTLNALTEIRATGSDFHKGGRQVLILTFTVPASNGWGPDSELKVVYKPADMEIDCLVAGNSAAVNAAIPGAPFLANSLVELFNAEAAAHPVAGLEPLPTYRILPRNRTSPLAGPGLPGLRDAYGYVEYLSHELTGLSWEMFNYYPFGVSDWVIFRGTDPTPVIARFYHQMGQLLAIASIFSLTDLHFENVRVRGYEPYLIDLEAALTKPVADIRTTLLFDAVSGGINCWRETVRIKWFNNAVGQSFLSHVLTTKDQRNRLYRYAPTNKHLVAVDPFLLAEGLRNGLAVLAALQPQAGMANWFVRAQNVLVRLLPVATQQWDDIRRLAYDSVQAAPVVPPLATTIGDEVRNLTTVTRASYPGLPNPPEYLAPADPQATADLNNFDIPVFYNRNGALDMLDSTGAVYAMPATVNVNPPGSPAVASGFGPGGARLTYFAGPPPAPGTAQNQLNALAVVGALAATTTTFTNQIVQHLRIAAMPLAPAVVL
jgi:hypothetical protein